MGAIGALGFVPPPTQIERPKMAEFEVLEPEPMPEPEPELAPEPKPEPEPEPEPKPKPKPKPKPAPVVENKPPEPPPEEEPPPAPEAPVDFTGVTLTADGSGSWSTAVGNGQRITAPVGRIAQVTGRERTGLTGGEVGGTGTKPRVLQSDNLSRRPGAPQTLNQLLEKNYPKQARNQGIEGQAVVRVRILPDGRLSVVRVKKETGRYGFGAACIATLRAGGRWVPALDQQGRPGAYEIDFPCTFEVAF